ncbi:MAG: alpha/beta hydrolase [Bacteroidia bacterium]
MKNVKRILRWVLILSFIFLLYLLFWPRHYKAQIREKDLTNQVWKLSTGSSIGFTYIPSGLQEHQPYPIIYLHGGPGGAISKRVVDDLKRLSNFGFDLYFYDQVGSGNSTRLINISDYTVQRHINDLYEIIKNIHSEKVILIGQSWGAILAAAYLSQHPETIDKIIFTSPGPVYPINNAEINFPAPDSLKIRKPLYTNKEANTSAGNIRMSTIKFIATRFAKKIASDKEVDQFADFLDTKSYKSALCDTSVVLQNRGGNGYYAGIMTYNDLFKMKDFRANIRGMNIPVLILKGECDNQPWGATQEYLSLFPNHKFILVPNAGHFINVEQPEIYIREIKNFLVQ